MTRRQSSTRVYHYQLGLYLSYLSFGWHHFGSDSGHVVSAPQSAPLHSAFTLFSFFFFHSPRLQRLRQHYFSFPDTIAIRLPQGITFHLLPETIADGCSLFDHNTHRYSWTWSLWHETRANKSEMRLARAGALANTQSTQHPLLRHPSLSGSPPETPRPLLLRLLPTRPLPLSRSLLLERALSLAR